MCDIFKERQFTGHSYLCALPVWKQVYTCLCTISAADRSLLFFYVVPSNYLISTSSMYSQRNWSMFLNLPAWADTPHISLIGVFLWQPFFPLNFTQFIWVYIGFFWNMDMHNFHVINLCSSTVYHSMKDLDWNSSSATLRMWFLLKFRKSPSSIKHKLRQHRKQFSCSIVKLLCDYWVSLLHSIT